MSSNCSFACGVLILKFHAVLTSNVNLSLFSFETKSLLKEVSVLLEALEKRQIELEQENSQLREDLAEATNMIEEGEKERKVLQEKLAEKEQSLGERGFGM